MLSFFNQGWVGIAIGCALGLILFFLGRRRAVPRVSITASHELTWGNSPNVPPGFALQFRGKNIDRVSRGVFRFWNDGSDTLTSDLISKHDPLKLVLEDGEFLLAGVTRETNKTNQFTVSIDPADPKIVNFTFDYVDPKEGVAIGFLHSSNVSMPKFSGTIKGHKPKVLLNKRSKVRPLARSKRRIVKVLPWVMVGLGAMTLAMVLAPPSWPFSVTNMLAASSKPTNLDEIFIRSMLWVISLTYGGLGCVTLWRITQRHPKSLDLNTVTEAKATVTKTTGAEADK